MNGRLGLAVVGGVFLSLMFLFNMKAFIVTSSAVGMGGSAITIRSKFGGVSLGRIPRSIGSTVTGGCPRSALGDTSLSLGRRKIGTCEVVCMAGRKIRGDVLVGVGATPTGATLTAG